MMEGEFFVCTSCGKPTIIFERTSKFLRPDKIIPFAITKEEAIKAIRERMRNGFFIPWSIRHFKVQRIVGIYVPFWLVDVKYHDKQKLHIKTPSSKGCVSEIYRYRDETINFKKLTVDASLNFCDESAERLEPFKIKDLVTFRECYLSGFYADCYDEAGDQLKDRVFKRCKELFDKESESALFNSNAKATIVSSSPEWEIKKEIYAMLPVWFLTIRYRWKPYTILVNGQTGKVVGAVPYVKTKVLLVFLALLALFL